MRQCRQAGPESHAGGNGHIASRIEPSRITSLVVALVGFLVVVSFDLPPESHFSGRKYS
jgi:hypothetical protein